MVIGVSAPTLVADGFPIPWPKPTTTTQPPANAAELPTLVADVRIPSPGQNPHTSKPPASATGLPMLMADGPNPIPWPKPTRQQSLRPGPLPDLAGLWVAQLCWVTRYFHELAWLGYPDNGHRTFHLHSYSAIGGGIAYGPSDSLLLMSLYVMLIETVAAASHYSFHRSCLFIRLLDHELRWQ